MAKIFYQEDCNWKEKQLRLSAMAVRDMHMH